jgi:hypothetical protein
MSEDLARQATVLKYMELALSDAQATVRAYDTKAQIVGIGYVFSINIVVAVSAGVPGARDEGLLPVLIFWGIVMTPLFLFGYVLYPSRKTAPKVEGASDLALKRVLYVETSRHATVEAYEKAAAQSDWLREMSFEILKVSKLRELKRARFIRALGAAAVSFGCLFILQVVRAW